MRALSSMATRHVLTDLFAHMRSAEDLEVTLDSMGGVDAATRLRAEHRYDLAFLSLDAMQSLAREGLVDKVTPLMVSEVAIAARSGAAESVITEPAFASADDMLDAMECAQSIGYSTGPSGTALVELVRRAGRWDELGPRMRQARPGTPVAALLARGEVELGFQQLSELVGQPGIRILGLMPLDCAVRTTFAGAIPAVAEDQQRSTRALESLCSPRSRRTISVHHFTPVSAPETDGQL